MLDDDCCAWLLLLAAVVAAALANSGELVDEIEPVRDSERTCCMSVASGMKSSLDLIVRFVVVVVVVRRSVVVARPLVEPAAKFANGSAAPPDSEPELESGVDSRCCCSSDDMLTAAAAAAVIVIIIVADS